MSGDIAFSGKPEEYEAAESFLLDIRDAIQDEGCGFVDIIVSAGNHDCSLIPNDSAREIVIEHIVKEARVDLDTNIIDKCTEPQSAFFKFRGSVTRSQPIHDHKLWTEYEFNFGGSTIRLSALNVAWMSRIPEKNGELVFPVDVFKHLLLAESAIHIAVLHHPLHWYCESSFHSLRRAIQMHCTVVLSGHEHVQSTMQSDMALTGQCVFFECGALQPNSPNEKAEFSVIRFDQSDCALIQRRFAISNYAQIENLKVIEASIPDCSERLGAASSLTETFQATLRDPGGNFIHPEKPIIYLDDIFVFPDVSDRISQDDRDFTAEKLLKLDDTRKRVLFIADEKAGKTTLLLEAFREWHLQGYFPLYVRGTQIKITKKKDFEEIMRTATKSEYSNPSIFEAAPMEKRMILIDNIDLLPGGHAALRPLIQYCDKHFSRIFVTATTGFEFAELLEEEAPEALSSFEVFEILNFGHKLRRRLIKKWCARTAIRNNTNIEEIVHQIEKVMNSVIGNNLIPAQPIFLLILLQSIDQRQEQELQNSGFAFYYQYLITKGLRSAGIHPEEIDELFNYLANLAWYLQKTDIKEIDEIQFRQFNNRFSERYITVDFEKRVKKLLAAKVIIQYGTCYSFAYPYIRYFFIGKYLADHSQDQEVFALVEEYCRTLHKRDRANCILFLTHHRNDLTVINRISEQLAQCFSEHALLEFGKDTNSLNSLIDSSTELLLGDVDVEANQEKARALRDRYERESHDEDEPDVTTGEMADFAMEVSTKINTLIKTAEILGQVLKNYYGSIERAKKLALMKELFDGPLRMLRFLVEDIITDPENFARELHRLIKKNKPSQAGMPTEKATRKLAFNLIGAICTGMVAKTASFVNSEKLEEDVANLVADRDSVSYRLISAAIKLTQPGRPPISDIQALSKELRDNHFAFTMLQSFGFHYLHMFRIGETDKQTLCAALKINQKAAHLIQARSRRQRFRPADLDHRK